MSAERGNVSSSGCALEAIGWTPEATADKDTTAQRVVPKTQGDLTQSRGRVREHMRFYSKWAYARFLTDRLLCAQQMCCRRLS